MQITGSSLFPAWFSKWILDYAEAHYAVIISPDYRLLPEARGTDILRDMEAFWMWFESGGPYQQLRGVGREEISLDRDKLLLLGESAGKFNPRCISQSHGPALMSRLGGYLSTQSILSGYVWPRAMIALYPMLDMKADHYTKEYPKPIVNVPNFPMSVVDDALASMPMQKPITEADPPARLDIALASVQTGRFLEFLGTEPELFVLDRLKEGQYSVSPGESIFPPLLIFHGEQDSAVPVEGSRRFLKIVEEIDCRHEHRAVFRQGDHGFDAGATLQDEWLHEGLEWISAKWLENRSRL